MDFKDHGFKPADVVKGLNEYYEKRKKDRDSTFIVRTGTDRIGETYYMNPEVYVKEAIDWLREEHNIFYTPGMKLEDDSKDNFDTPRYRFLSILSSELGFRTIVGPGNADKVEQDILRAVKHRNELAKDADDNRREFLRNLRCELGVLYPVANGCIEEMEYDILERIGKLKEGNWPCENSNTFAEHMRKQFPKECEKWNVVPLQGGSVHDWVQYIFGMLDEWRKRAVKAEEERDRAWSDCGKYKGMLNTMYGASSLRVGVGPSSIGVLSDGTLINREDFADLVGLARQSSWSQIFEKIRGVLNDNNRMKHFRDEVYISINYPPHTSERFAVDEVKAYRTALRELYFATVGVNPDNGANPDAMKSVILQRFKQKDTDQEHTKELYDMPLYLLGQLTSACKGYLGCGDIPVQEMVKQLESRKDSLAELRAKVREIYRAFHGCWKDGYSYTSALNDINEEYQRLKHDTNYFREFEKNCSERQAFIFKLCEALDIDKENIGSFFDDEEAAILKAIEDNNKATASVYGWNQAYSDVRRLLDISPDADSGEMVGALNKIICDHAKLEMRLNIAKMMRTNSDRRRKMWHSRYESEHERANGEHKRAEKALKEVRDWIKRCDSLEQALNAKINEEVGLDAFKNEIRKLRDEKAKVIKALGQDIWDDCIK